jgi:hypothetical protein
MSSLADIPELIGFFSYSREDDQGSRGALSALRDAIQSELSAQLGRSQTDFRVWQDKAAISLGTLWEKQIAQGIEQSVFFIPIVTPRALRSQHCAFEFQSFLAREAELGRDDLVFPILYILVPALEDEKIWRDDPVLKIVGTRQYLDSRELRHHDPHSTKGWSDSARALRMLCISSGCRGKSERARKKPRGGNAPRKSSAARLRSWRPSDWPRRNAGAATRKRRAALRRRSVDA